LNTLIGKDVTLIAGGRAAVDYQTILDEIGAFRVNNYDHFKLVLDGLRAQTSFQDYA
jgi:MerR family transcriptional regulator, light-induced transcriptional regulator